MSNKITILSRTSRIHQTLYILHPISITHHLRYHKFTLNHQSHLPHSPPTSNPRFTSSQHFTLNHQPLPTVIQMTTHSSSAVHSQSTTTLFNTNHHLASCIYHNHSAFVISSPPRIYNHSHLAYYIYCNQLVYNLQSIPQFRIKIGTDIIRGKLLYEI